jgi:glycosyltransferase involved in cell wall biosynthesis
VEKYYAQAHVCVIPSKGEEAFPRVALEAVIEGFNGYIFERGNPEALKEKLSLALENWEKFSAKRAINKILEIFTR